MSKQTISIVISAFNEEKKIKECLESVAFADEIIFVDNTSSDNTVEIAKKFTDKIFTRQNNKMLNVNKNFGFEKASSDWILSLDADERVSKELAEEIVGLVSEQSESDGYLIPRKNIIFGKWIEHTGWYPDHQLRLFKKNRGKFAEKHVHELITIEGTTSQLEHSLIHYNYETITQFLQKMTMIYAANEADNLLEGGYVFSWKDAIRFPFQEFLRRYFASSGYKDGLHGLVLSLLMSFYHLVVFVHIWEKKEFAQIPEKEITLLPEINVIKKEWRYWTNKKQIDEEKNPLKKMSLKLRHKIN